MSRSLHVLRRILREQSNAAGRLEPGPGLGLAPKESPDDAAADGGGSVLLTVTTDASGNFYASRAVGFGSGLYTDVTGTGGARRAMKAAVTGGACNSCHDASNRIRADQPQRATSYRQGCRG